MLKKEEPMKRLGKTKICMVNSVRLPGKRRIGKRGLPLKGRPNTLRNLSVR